MMHPGFLMIQVCLVFSDRQKKAEFQTKLIKKGKEKQK